MARPKIAWAHVTLDCADPARAARFWGGLLGLEPKGRDDGWWVLGPTAPGGPMLYLQPVPEPTPGRARGHLDLWVDDLDAAIALVEELGGTHTGEVHEHDRGTVVVMADTEGTELCLISFPVPKVWRGAPA